MHIFIYYMYSTRLSTSTNQQCHSARRIRASLLPFSVYASRQGSKFIQYVLDASGAVLPTDLMGGDAKARSYRGQQIMSFLAAWFHQAWTNITTFKAHSPEVWVCSGIEIMNFCPSFMKFFGHYCHPYPGPIYYGAYLVPSAWSPLGSGSSWYRSEGHLLYHISLSVSFVEESQ